MEFMGKKDLKTNPMVCCSRINDLWSPFFLMITQGCHEVTSLANQVDNVLIYNGIRNCAVCCSLINGGESSVFDCPSLTTYDWKSYNRFMWACYHRFCLIVNLTGKSTLGWSGLVKCLGNLHWVCILLWSLMVLQLSFFLYLCVC